MIILLKIFTVISHAYRINITNGVGLNLWYSDIIYPLLKSTIDTILNYKSTVLKDFQIRIKLMEW